MRALTILGAGIGWLTLASAAETDAQGRTFVESLRAAGWQVEVLVDGSLELMPDPRAPAADQASEPETGAPAASGAAEPPTPDWATLRDHGWRVETDADGSTLLYPPSPAAEKAAPDPATPPAPVAVPAATPDAAAARDEVARDLDALLAERGWRAKRESDGTVLLFPLRRAENAPRGMQRAAGVVPAAVTESKVTLPIDTWNEARVVAASWLESVGDPSLRLGKVRAILRVYVVSIVDKAPPHALRHQISIGADDGRILVLN
jgi:hypothetical protein